MWIPSTDNYRSIDMILQDFESRQIIFIQVSIQKPHSHKDKTGELKVLKAFKSKLSANNQQPDKDEQQPDSRNLIEKELEMMTQSPGWKAEYKDNTLRTNEISGWNVKFLFISSVPESKIKKKNKNTPTYPISNILIIGKEQLGRLGVRWDWILWESYHSAHLSILTINKTSKR